MNKQLLLLITLVAGSQLLAKTAEERLIEFHALKDNEKTAWMNFMKDTMDQKMNIMRQIHQDWSKFHTDWIKKFGANADCSPEGKEQLFNEKLNGAIELHKKHMTMWEDFAKSHHEKATKLCDENKKEFDKFEGKEEKHLKKELKETKQQLEATQPPMRKAK